jgi:drug/metabolite transporter (DMT)-like permease
VLALRRDGSVVTASVTASPRLTPRLVLLLTLPPMLWAGNAVVGRMAVGSVPPLALNALRWALASLLLLPLGWRALATPQARAQVAARWKELAVLGFLGVGCYNAFQYLALRTSTPVNVTLIAASLPLGMMAVGAIGYRVRPLGREWAGAALSLAGVLVVLSHGEPAALARVHFVTGDLLMLVAVACWSAYSWRLARPPASLSGAARPRWNWAEALLLQTLSGGAFAAVAAGVEAGVTHAPIVWSPWVAFALAYVAIGPSVIAYRCWGQGVAEAGPAVAGFFSNLTPAFAALLSAAVLGEPPQPFHGLAFALIVAGIVVSSRR